jgi:hypothetical protein
VHVHARAAIHEGTAGTTRELRQGMRGPVQVLVEIWLRMYRRSVSLGQLIYHVTYDRLRWAVDNFLSKDID